MSSWGSLERFLKTDPGDAGCAETFDLLDRYVERELAHGDAAEQFPGIAAHLSSLQSVRAGLRGASSRRLLRPADSVRREK